MATKKKNKKKDDDLNIIMRKMNKEGLKIKFASESKDKEKIPFGIEPLDNFIGGGILCGNFHILYGGVGAGKSASGLCAVAQAQRMGKRCAWIDLEHTWDSGRAKLFGVNVEDLILYEDSETAEEAMEVSRILSKEGIVELIVVDSIQAMSPHLQQYKTKAKTQFREIKEDEMASLAKKMGKFINVTKDFIFKSKVAVLLIGQARTNIGGYGNMEELTGGKAIKYFSMLTLYMRRGAVADAPSEKYKEYTIKDGKETYKTKERPVGFNCVVKIDKHKITGCSTEGSALSLPFYFNDGFNHKEELDEAPV